MGMAWSAREKALAARTELSQERELAQSIDGRSMWAPQETIERVERMESLAARGALGSSRWMDSRDLVAWAKGEEKRR